MNNYSNTVNTYFITFGISITLARVLLDRFGSIQVKFTVIVHNKQVKNQQSAENI